MWRILASQFPTYPSIHQVDAPITQPLLQTPRVVGGLAVVVQETLTSPLVPIPYNGVSLTTTAQDITLPIYWTI